MLIVKQYPCSLLDINWNASNKRNFTLERIGSCLVTKNFYSANHFVDLHTLDQVVLNLDKHGDASIVTLIKMLHLFGCFVHKSFGAVFQTRKIEFSISLLFDVKP